MSSIKLNTKSYAVTRWQSESVHTSTGIHLFICAFYHPSSSMTTKCGKHDYHSNVVHFGDNNQGG